MTDVKNTVSVIVPTHNRASLLPRALRSVQAQKMADQIELIVIDDGSVDDTAKLIRREFPEAIYHYQPNQGVSAARNQGLKLATGQWIALLDSDDEWLPNKIASQLALLDSSDLLVCHTDELWVRNGVRVNQMKKHKKHGGWIFEYCLPLCAMSPSSVILHRSVFDDVGGFDESLPACEDYDLWLRVCANYEVAFLDSPMLIKYGGHKDQLSRQYWGMDRFRVLALEKIITQTREAKLRQAALDTLLNKLEILLIGARKHQNTELLDECERKLMKYR